MPEDLEGKSLTSLVSNDKDAKSPCDYFSLLPRSLQDPWPTSGYVQLAEECTPGLCAYIHKNACLPWLQTHPCPNREKGVGQLLSPQPPQILAKTYCLFQDGPPPSSGSDQSETAGNNAKHPPLALNTRPTGLKWQLRQSASSTKTSSTHVLTLSHPPEQRQSPLWPAKGWLIMAVSS